MSLDEFEREAFGGHQIEAYRAIMSRWHVPGDTAHAGTWEGNWDVVFRALLSGRAYILDASPHVEAPYNTIDSSNWPYDTGDWPDCPRPTPPCTTCLPQIGTVFYDFSAYAPLAVISGEATCPASSLESAWCPPSVGNPVTLSADFTSPNGATAHEDCFGPVDGFSRVCLTLSWDPRDGPAHPLVWDFDDQHVDPTTGKGTRTPTVTSNENQSVTHTFEYSSAFDPIRGCVRPCAGDLKGPAMPGYPNGTPAFQVSVSSDWYLYYTTEVWNFEGDSSGPRTVLVDLRQFGSPNPWFTSVTTLPLYVVSYGSVTP